MVVDFSSGKKELQLTIIFYFHQIWPNSVSLQGIMNWKSMDEPSDNGKTTYFTRQVFRLHKLKRRNCITRTTESISTGAPIVTAIKH